jgi:ABC-type nickel/cobalt efflux system permease component RcnA
MNNLMDLLDAEQLMTMAALFLPKIAAAIVVLIAFWVIRRVTRTPVRLALRGAGFEEALVGLFADSVYGGPCLCSR